MLYQVAITPDARIITQEFDIEPRKLTDEEFKEYSVHAPEPLDRNLEYYILTDKVTFGSTRGKQLLSPEMAQGADSPVAIVRPPSCKSINEFYCLAWQNTSVNLAELKLHAAECFLKIMLSTMDKLMEEADLVKAIKISFQINSVSHKLHQLIKSDEEMMAVINETKG
jgi:hypothetical protein